MYGKSNYYLVYGVLGKYVRGGNYRKRSGFQTAFRRK
jgi:hypothetical protein